MEWQRGRRCHARNISWCVESKGPPKTFTTRLSSSSAMALVTDGSLNSKRDVPMSSIITVIYRSLTRFKTRHLKGKSEDTPQELKTKRSSEKNWKQWVQSSWRKQRVLRLSILHHHGYWSLSEGCYRSLEKPVLSECIVCRRDKNNKLFKATCSVKPPWYTAVSPLTVPAESTRSKEQWIEPWTWNLLRRIFYS